MGNYALTCDYCGNPFEARRADATYCSDRCRKASAREAEQLEQTAWQLPGYALVLGIIATARLREGLRVWGVAPKGGGLQYKDHAIRPHGISRARWDAITYTGLTVTLSSDEVRIINANYPGAVQSALVLDKGRMTRNPSTAGPHDGLKAVQKW